MEGFVAYFDILGFSESMKHSDFSDKIDKYSEILDYSLRRDERDLEYIFFSDSVIINSKTSDESQLLHISTAMSEISYHLLIDLELPICGCISHGRFTKLEKNGNVMITGSPILDAIKYEEKQNWVGTMLSPELVRKYRQINDMLKPLGDYPEKVNNYRKNFLFNLCVYRYWEIPFTDTTYSGFVITPKNYISTTLEETLENLKKYRQKLGVEVFCI